MTGSLVVAVAAVAGREIQITVWAERNRAAVVIAGFVALRDQSDLRRGIGAVGIARIDAELRQPVVEPAAGGGRLAGPRPRGQRFDRGDGEPH